MKNFTPLTRNILISFSLLFFVQLLFFTGIVLLLRLDKGQILVYCIAAFAFHTATGLIIAQMEHFFIFEADNKKPLVVNLANFITFMRISSIPTIFFLFLNIEYPGVRLTALIFLGFIFLTDFLDGYIARYRKEITIIGKYLDSASDYLLLIATSIIIYIHGLMNSWFFIIVMTRLVFHAFVVIGFSIGRKKIIYTLSFLGKVSVFAVMTFYIIALLPLFDISFPVLTNIISIMEYIVAGILTISFFEKLMIIKKAITQPAGN
jgi:phosphatidylglycerophosphate synthase